MNKKKLVLSCAFFLLVFAFVIPFVNAARNGVTGLTIQTTYNIATDSNFFGNVENQELAPVPADVTAELTLRGYVFCAETSSLQLYVKESTGRNEVFDLAVYDLTSGYLWYSVYPGYAQLGYSGTSKYFLESGVIIEYYNLENILQEDSKSYLSGSRYNVGITYDYDAVDNGVLAHLDYADLGIRFDVIVELQEGKLVVTLPIDSLVETDIEETMLNPDMTTTIKTVSYRLKAVYLFPYFGANNYEINGYSMIPDGSGALIRYTNERSATAYIKRIYGADEGLGQSETSASTWYLREESTATVPVFGVNHGYRQAAFLAIVTEGAGTTEIHSYPYGYMSYTINTTFFKFIVRERYTIQTSSNAADSFQLINTDPYPTDYQVEYRFLSNEDASYAGMAAAYRDYLGVSADGAAAKASLQLTVIGLDYKRGLFGKNYVAMTTYAELADIVSELQAAGVADVEAVYLGWNQGGFYDNAAATPRASGLLGGSAGLAELQQSGVELYYYTDPLVSFQASIGDGVIKKITLANFATATITTSLFANVYYRSPTLIADAILADAARYMRLGVTAFAFETVGRDLFSYREDGTNHDRNETLATIRAELEALSAYDLALVRPNGYLWNLIDSYYQTPVESNKYAYVTDSIPFIPLVLHGAIDLYSSYVNYVSDDDLFRLRLIEYGIMPAFLISAEPTYKLRYTNSAYVYTSQYDLWRETIVAMYQGVGTALAMVSGAMMTEHRYVAEGVAETTYANGVVIYVNYTAVDVVTGGVVVPAKAARVVTP